MPLDSSKDPKVGPKAKTMKEEKSWGMLLTCNISGVGLRAGAFGWD
jgi:hypothetical protein